MSRRDFLKGVLATGSWGALSRNVPGAKGISGLGGEPGAGPPCSRHVAAQRAAESADGDSPGHLPRRVSWVHDPKSAQWDGNPRSGGWFEDKFTDPVLADTMLRQSLRLLCGARTDAEAWVALFRHHNRTHGREDAGYQPGERVAVKINMNCSSRHADSVQGLYNTPQVTKALMRQLVQRRSARVRPSRL